MLTCFLCTSYLMPGHNPGESLRNLQNWLDAVASSSADSSSLVKRIDGSRLHGVYHNMLQRKHSIFMRTIQSMSEWHIECRRNACSCGTLLSLEPGGGGGYNSRPHTSCIIYDTQLSLAMEIANHTLMLLQTNHMVRM